MVFFFWCWLFLRTDFAHNTSNCSMRIDLPDRSSNRIWILFAIYIIIKILFLKGQVAQLCNLKMIEFINCIVRYSRLFETFFVINTNALYFALPKEINGWNWEVKREIKPTQKKTQSIIKCMRCAILIWYIQN